ncbi:MAG: hypothetical protein JHC98_03120 [Thermoleophilaceae bacterium]|nr:hypothetical protein [Thermoleophilaceae bacterium]
MNTRTFTLLLVACGTLLVSAIGVAGARVGKDRPAAPPPARVSVLKQPFQPTRRQRRELLKLRRQVAKSPHASIASTASVPDARPIELPEGLGDAWVSMADDGAVCTFIPDPLGGYGSSCATQEDLRTGGAVTVLGGAGQLNNKAIAVIVVPDGGQDPVVTEPDGRQEHPQVDGIGATVVPERSRVSVGAVSLEIPEFDPHCSTSPNEDFRRCGL